MLTRVYISLFTFLFVFGIWGGSSAIAQKYTTNSRLKTTSSSLDSRSVKCTIEDLNVIKKFDIKAERVSKILNEPVDEKVMGVREAEKYEKDIRKSLAFFYSDEYEQMKAVYKRCGLNIPIYQYPTQFWIPDKMNIDSSTCSGCAKK